MIDWWQIITDIRQSGLSIAQAALHTGIPRTTLLGYRNDGAEPRHSDGELLLKLWRDRRLPAVPSREGRRKGR